MQSATPHTLLHAVWPLPLSLATTYGISVDFSSSPYLDVSVQAVPLIYLCIPVSYTHLDVYKRQCHRSVTHTAKEVYKIMVIVIVNFELIRLFLA